jgi:phosphate-selective porin OprO/OprP
VGRSKSPLGLEHLYSDAALPFAERTLGSNLSPNRDVGVTVLGQMWGGRASYAAGVLNGVADAASGDLDVNDGKDLVARGVLRAGPISLALAGSRGRATGTLAGFRTTAQQTFFVYAPETQASGLRRRVTPSMAFYQGRFGGFVEYFRNTHAISRGGVRDDVTHQAWTATAIVVLTGESLSDRGAAPRAPFSPADGHWGALQVGLRYSELSLDERTFGLGLASDGSSRRARATGVSLVWYHSTHVKHVLTIERTTFLTPVTPRRPELAAIYRAQVNLAPGF